MASVILLGGFENLGERCKYALYGKIIMLVELIVFVCLSVNLGLSHLNNFILVNATELFIKF